MVLYSSKLTTPEPVTSPDPNIPPPTKIKKPRTKNPKPTTPEAPEEIKEGGGEPEVVGVGIEELPSEPKVKKELSERQKEAIERRKLRKLEEEEAKIRELEKQQQDWIELELKKELAKEKRKLNREARMKRDQVSRALVDEGVEAPSWVRGFVNQIKQEQNAVIKVVMGRYLNKRNLNEKLSKKLASKLIKYGLSLNDVIKLKLL
jgi:hypothetical protein